MGAQAGVWDGIATRAGRFLTIEIGANVVALRAEAVAVRATRLANAKFALTGGL